jgi:IclR family pca regulon transcriptional regulator
VTPHTITDRAVLHEALRQVREQGYSIVDEELEPGLLSASAPVRDRSGAVVAALASSTSTGRSTVEQLRTAVVPELMATADRISASLGAAARAS